MATPPVVPHRRWARRTSVPPTADAQAVAAAMTTLELTVRRRLDGLLHGSHLGLVPAPGSELGDARPYEAGDDVRRMDWAVTARTTVPHIRQTIADRELETWLVVDLSASLDFGTADCEKRDLAVVAAAAIAHLTRGGGNRIGAVVVTGQGRRRIPARGGRAAVGHLLTEIATTPRSTPGGRGDLATALEMLRRPPRRRGLAVVISDFVGPTDWQRPLRALAGRHELLAIEVTDPRDLRLPSVGVVTLTDPESGRSRKVDTTPRLRAEFAEAAAAHRAEVARQLRSAGADRLSLSTDRDPITDILRFALGRRRGWNGAAAPGAGVAGSG